MFQPAGALSLCRTHGVTFVVYGGTVHMRGEIVMAGMPLMSQQEIENNPVAWKITRQGGVTASEIASVMGISPKSHESAFSLFVQKTTGQEPEHDNDEMLRGRVLEPYVAEAFEAAHPWLELHPGGLYASESRPWQMATFDRLAVDLDKFAITPLSDQSSHYSRYIGMPVEIKTSIPNDDFGDPMTAHLPVHIKAQAMWQLDVWEADTVWVPVQFMMPWKLVTFVVERTEAVEHDLDLMRAEALEFMERIRTDTPPPVDWRPATARALKSLHPELEDRAVRVPVELARRYRAARLAKDRAKQRIAQAENELMLRMSGAKYAVADDHGRTVKVASRVKSKRPYFPADVIRDKYPDVAKDVVQESDVDYLVSGSWAR